MPTKSTVFVMFWHDPNGEDTSITVFATAEAATREFNRQIAEMREDDYFIVVDYAPNCLPYAYAFSNAYEDIPVKELMDGYDAQYACTIMEVEVKE
jgi:hypothetical protein